jgi:hypothetical protein
MVNTVEVVSFKAGANSATSLLAGRPAAVQALRAAGDSDTGDHSSGQTDLRSRGGVDMGRPLSRYLLAAQRFDGIHSARPARRDVAG